MPAGIGDRGLGMLGVKGKDQGIVVVEFRMRDPRVGVGVVSFPTDEVLQGAPVKP